MFGNDELEFYVGEMTMAMIMSLDSDNPIELVQFKQKRRVITIANNLVKLLESFVENELKTIYPDSDYDSRKTLTGEDNLLDQEISREELNIVDPDSENKLEKTTVDAENQIQN